MSTSNLLYITCYSIAFGYPDIYSLRAFDVFVEIVFLIDIIRSNSLSRINCFRFFHRVPGHSHSWAYLWHKENLFSLHIREHIHIRCICCVSFHLCDWLVASSGAAAHQTSESLQTSGRLYSRRQDLGDDAVLLSEQRQGGYHWQQQVHFEHYKNQQENHWYMRYHLCARVSMVLDGY